MTKKTKQRPTIFLPKTDNHPSFQVSIPWFPFSFEDETIAHRWHKIILLPLRARLLIAQDIRDHHHMT